MNTSKRILICNAQVPFVRGGAEYLVEGLRDALVARGHTADIVQIPFCWHPVERIPEHALAWRLLDLTHVNGVPIDQVICTKFPSYLVRHPRKVVWLVHQHRQAYDQYGTALSDFFNIPEHRRIREMIFAMDRQGIGEAQARYTISRNVSERLRTFTRLDAEALYPPSRYAGKLTGAAYGDYILSSARLDDAKRIDLLLEALAQTRHPVKALIAGHGPAREKLEAQAVRLQLGERVRFLGFVDDATLVDLYTHARAVYYAPIDEDYGFATVEALEAARPVLTTNDSGGVLEFIRDGIQGYVTEPDAHALAAQIDVLAAKAELAAQLGANGPELARSITWDRVIERLVLA